MFSSWLICEFVKIGLTRYIENRSDLELFKTVWHWRAGHLIASTDISEY